MKPYTVEVDIELPRQRVIELFDNPKNMPCWQKGLQSFEPISGTPGQPGAKSKLVYQTGKKAFDLIETVIERKLPDEFNGRYEWYNGSNTLRNRFIVLGPNKTRWESTCEYHFTSLMPKVMGMLFPGMFRKQTLGFMRNFKAFCEEGRDVRKGH